MEHPVTKMSPIMVCPAEPTPTGHLPLSCLDRIPVNRCFVETFLVYRHRLGHGHDPANVVRAALARALVPYYPVAGRITRSDDGELRVSCTGEGVPFVEASAGCRLEDANYVESEPFVICKEKLLPSPPPGVEREAFTFMMQVTKFMCGGFIMGFLGNHTFFDGIGIAQFLVAVGEMARGLDAPTVNPVWRRESIPNTFPLGIQLTRTGTIIPTPQYIRHAIDLRIDDINRLKNQYTKQTGQKCSDFDVVAAMLWQCRTRAIELPEHADVCLDFPTNIRPELHRELPRDGYYGNCLCKVFIEAKGGYVADAPLSDIMTMIKCAKEDLSSKFHGWLKGYRPVRSPRQPIAYGSLCMTDIRRVGFYEADYGWGTPVRVVPIYQYPIGLCTVLNSPAPKSGIRVLVQCVAKEHLVAFCNEIKEMVFTGRGETCRRSQKRISKY